MPGKVTNQLFDVKSDYLRSIHLERDWSDPSALSGYVLTPHGKSNLARLTAGLEANSSRRAWRITGDYGCGKSSFALLLAHLFAGHSENVPASLADGLLPTVAAQPRLLPVLVTGSREALGKALLRALEISLSGFTPTRSAPLALKQVRAALNGAPPTDQEVLRLVESAQSYVSSTSRANGLLIVLDELGKFLEFAALRPDSQDVYLLQGLAELAARSGKSPIFVVGLLHQGFSAYSETLTRPNQREWEKVAGRYEELSGNNPLEQVVAVISRALNVSKTHVPPKLKEIALRDMSEVIDLRWYGSGCSAQALCDSAISLFPLHPSVVPPLIRLFSRFAQNERSLFTFLLGDEPFGLQDFVERTNGEKFFRISDLFDYARANFSQRLNRHNYRIHWSAVDAIVTSFPVENEVELEVLKTVGILNVLDSNDLNASTTALQACFSHSGGLDIALRRLRKAHVLHFRGVAGGYSLWPHTSVNLEKAYQDADRALGSIQQVAPHIVDRLATRPLVARRHYIETGNLRHFDVRYCGVGNLASELSTSVTGDGRIIVPLCETADEEAQALAFAQSAPLASADNTLLAIPRTLHSLAAVVDEVRRWEWVERNVPELCNDKYASEEVSRQVAAARHVLDEQLGKSVGLTNGAEQTGLRWFHCGQEQQDVKSGRALLSWLSDISDTLFPDAPRIKNELINRQSLSSAAAAARQRLIDLLLTSPNEEFLGMDSAKKPPEMSMYLSVLKASGLHQRSNGRWQLALPSAAFDHLHCNILPTFNRINQILSENLDTRVSADTVLASLKSKPWGLRDGLAGLFLAVFTTIHDQEVAFYEDGTFIPRMTGPAFMRLLKAPDTFQIQLFPLTSVRTELFRRIIEVLNIPTSAINHVALLDVIRPLTTFVAGLPNYSLQTTHLSPEALNVRKAIATAQEPSTLLFHDLPAACGVNNFGTGQGNAEDITVFAGRLRNAVDELRAAYPSLLSKISTHLELEFGLNGGLPAFREAVGPRAARLAHIVTEQRLKTFCLKIADGSLPDRQWLESLGSFVCSLPPAKWQDKEVRKFEQEINTLCSHFIRVEATAFNGQPHHDLTATRLSLTQADGHEIDQVVYLSAQEADAAETIEHAITALLQEHGRIGVAAATRALWRALAPRG